MSIDLLFADFDRLIQSAESVHRLRRFILDLAVRGKLAPQDPNDEPASELLKRIAAEKARLVKARKAKREKALPPISEDQTKVTLPTGWFWCRLGNLSKLVTSGSRGWAKYYSREGAIFVRMGNLSKENYRLRLDHIQHVKPPSNREGTRTQLDTGDLLISITGDVGMLGLIPENFGEAYINQHTAMVRPVDEMKGHYLAEFFRSPFAQDQFNAPQRGIKNSFRLTDITQFLVPLPPLAEQHRIVAKVDELMVLCDRLEAARAAREATRDRLATASLARLNTPDPEPTIFQRDVAFALNNLTPITTRPDQIKALRQTILNLAVQGKLVEQDPNDEPASELLRRLRANTDGKARRKARNSEDINAGEVPFECPAGWTWTKVQQTLNPDREISYGVIKLGDEPRAGGIPTLRCSDVRAGFIDRSGVRKVDEAIESEYARTRLLGGEVVINIRGTLGGVALVPHDLNGFNVAREVAVVPIANEISGPFVVYLMLSPYFWDHIQNNLRGIAYKGLNLGILREIPIPLPPLAEQRRIVGKVNELMALCNQLEASLATGDETRGQLVDALLQEALNLDANWPKPKQTLRIM